MEGRRPDDLPLLYENDLDRELEAAAEVSADSVKELNFKLLQIFEDDTLGGPSGFSLTRSLPHLNSQCVRRTGWFLCERLEQACVLNRWRL